MDQQTLEEIDARRMREVAFHEAAHVVASVAVGAFNISAMIEREDGPPVFGGHRWSGRCEHGSPETGEDSAVVGLAGVAAELMLGTPGITGDEITESVAAGEIDPSDSDWKSIGQAFGRDTFSREDWAALADTTELFELRARIAERTKGLLRTNWAAVEAVANWLVEKRSCADWDLIELGLFDLMSGGGHHAEAN